MRTGDKMTLVGLVNAVHYNGQAVTLVRTCGDGKWTVRLDAHVWKLKELNVKTNNLRETDPLRQLPDKIVLQMSKLMGVGLKRGFLTWKCIIEERKQLRIKAQKVINRILNLHKVKALNSLKLYAQGKKAARAEARRQRAATGSCESRTCSHTSNISSSSAGSEGPSQRFIGRKNPKQFPSDHGRPDFVDFVAESHHGAEFHNSSASDLYRAPVEPSSRTPHAFEADDGTFRKVNFICEHCHNVPSVCL